MDAMPLSKRLLRAFYAFEKRMPPWLKRIWVPALLFFLVLAVILATMGRIMRIF